MSSTTTTRICSCCGERLPVSMFRDSHGYPDRQCRMCRNKRQRENYRRRKLGMKPLPALVPKRGERSGERKEPAHIARKGVTCAFHCAHYPCFEGINNITSNLALTCHSYKRR